jgi:hypothetical protein
MLLTWHKKKNLPNLWLDLDCQLKEENIYFKKLQHRHQIYNNGLLKLKNMDWFVLCASIYMYFCAWILFGIYYRVSIYDMFIKKEHVCKTIDRKKLTKKTLWTFEWPKWSHIFISPYHNHFWVDFNLKFLYMYIKKKIRMAYFCMGFSVH